MESQERFVRHPDTSVRIPTALNLFKQGHRERNEGHEQRGPGRRTLRAATYRTRSRRRRGSPRAHRVSRPQTATANYPLAGNHFLDARLEVVLMNRFRRIGNGFSRGRERGLVKIPAGTKLAARGFYLLGLSNFTDRRLVCT